MKYRTQSSTHYRSRSFHQAIHLCCRVTSVTIAFQHQASAMRRAFQRCTASLSRTPLSLPSTGNTCLRSNLSHQTVHRSGPLARHLHQSLRLQQQAAAQAVSEPEHVPNGKITRFEELETQNVVHPNIVRTLTGEMGLETMTEVQQATINEALSGRDIIAQARTGTGKTLAFLLPILQNIINIDPRLVQRASGGRGPRTTADDIRALIISPTRELAEQIAQEARRLVKNTGVIVQTAVGGTQKSAGLRAIQREGCHILVGTPGRLKDILSDSYTRVEAPDLSALVFDEADRLLDQGFWPEIQEIMRLLPTPAEKDRQTMMFSATVPREVVDLVRRTLKPGFQYLKTVRDDEEPTHTRVPQRVVTVRGFENKLPALVELCSNAIEAGQLPGGRPFKAIVYYNSTAEVTLAASALRGLKAPGSEDQLGRKHPWPSTKLFDIHAKLTQNARTYAADAFRRCDSGILLSSDVTARGMDFPNVTHVIQMAIPPSREQYVHRIGRTARAGKEGEGWLILSPEEAQEARHRLNRLPLQAATSLATANLDLTQEGQIPAQAGAVLQMVQQAMRAVPMMDKFNVYKALLGVYGWLGNKQTLVRSMNNLAQYGWGMQEPPTINPGLAQRLGLSRIPGVRVGREPAFEGSAGRGGFGGRDDRGGARGGGYQGRDDSRRDSYGGGRGERSGSYGGGRSDSFGGRSDSFGGRSDSSGGRSDSFGGRSNSYGGRSNTSGGRSDSFGGRSHLHSGDRSGGR